MKAIKVTKQLGAAALSLLMLLGAMTGCGKKPADDPSSPDGSSTVSDNSDPVAPDASGDISAPTGTGDASDPDSTGAQPSGTSGSSNTKPNDKPNSSSTPGTKPDGKDKTVKVGGLTVHSASTPYVTGGTLPITVMLPYTEKSPNMAKQAFTAYYEKQSGMKVTYNFYISSDIFVLKKTMMASGNLPDIFVSVPVGFICSEVERYGKEKQFADLTDKLQTWAPNVYERLNSGQHPYGKTVAYAPGKVYSLPQIHPTVKEGGSISTIEEAQLMINTAWLEELGLSAPTTTDELYKVAKAFAEEDPDGNGKDDTFGFGTNLWRPQLWNPWGLAMSWYYTGTVTEKGEVLSGLLTDQFREGCRFYNRLWNEGIFNKKMIGAEGATLKAQVHKTGIVSMSFVSAYLSDSELKDWKPIAWCKGANTGDLLAGISQPEYLDSYENMFFVSAKAKSVEACLRWIDYFYTNDGAMLWTYGPEGKAYTKVGDKYKLKKNSAALAADQRVISSYAPMTPANITARNSSELTTREKFGAFVSEEATRVNRLGKYNFSKLVQTAKESEKAKIDKLQSPGDIQWGYQAIRGEVNVETDWNSYKSKNSKDYAAWKSIYQQVFDRSFK